MNNRSYELNLAAQQGDLDRVKHLIEKEGVSVNARANIKCNNEFFLKESTALHQACQGLKTQVVRYLLEKGADVNAKAGREGYTPFHAVALCGAAFEGRDTGHLTSARAIVRMLFDKGSNPHALTEMCIDGRCYLPIDFAHTYELPSVRDAINNLTAKNQATAVSESNGKCSLQIMSEDDIKKVVDILTHLVKLNNPEARINNDHFMMNGPVRLAYFKRDHVIEIAGINDTGESEDVPRDVLKVMSAIPKHIINYHITFPEHHTGYAGMGTYTGSKCIVIQADIKKLVEYRDNIVSQIKKEHRQVKERLNLTERQLQLATAQIATSTEDRLAAEQQNHDEEIRLSKESTARANAEEEKLAALQKSESEKLVRQTQQEPLRDATEAISVPDPLIETTNNEDLYNQAEQSFIRDLNRINNQEMKDHAQDVLNHVRDLADSGVCKLTLARNLVSAQKMLTENSEPSRPQEIARASANFAFTRANELKGDYNEISKKWRNLGIAFMVLGAVIAAAGVACLVTGIGIIPGAVLTGCGAALFGVGSGMVIYNARKRDTPAILPDVRLGRYAQN